LPDRFTKRGISTRLYLLGLVAAVVVPLLAFATFLLAWYVAMERARFERDAIQIARQTALVVDGQLGDLVGLLRGLAASSALADGDLARFHTEATRLVEGSDSIVVLRDFGSRQYVNTQRAFGADLPPAPPLSTKDVAAFSEGRSVVSGVYKSPISGEARIAVAVPIVVNGTPKYVLAVTVPTSHVYATLVPAVPSGWSGGVGRSFFLR
jgi:hypothetical protein